MEPEKGMFEQWADEKARESWLERKLRFIPLWWDNEGRYTLRNIKTGFKNIFYWLPIIWKDRHWDSHYIFEIMMHKLKAQSKYIGSRDIHTRAKRDAEVMMTCVRLMKLVQDETYSSEYSDYHKTKHWFEPTEKEGYSSWESKLLTEDFDGYIKKYPLIEKRVMNGDSIYSLDGEDHSEILQLYYINKQRVAMSIGHLNHERARKLLFKIMEANIERWWD